MSVVLGHAHLLRSSFFALEADRGKCTAHGRLRDEHTSVLLPLLTDLCQRRIGTASDKLLQGRMLFGADLFLSTTALSAWREIASLALLFEIAAKRRCRDLEGLYHILARHTGCDRRDHALA